MTDQEKDDLRNRLLVVENELLDRLEKAEGDARWLALAKTHLEQGFMCWKRGLYEGKRVGET